MHVGALLLHVLDHLTAAVPSPYALATEGSKILLLDGQRVRSSSHIDVPQDVPELAETLREAAVRILDEAQDLVMSSTGSLWPQGPSPHPAAAWTETGTLRLGYYPSGDDAREAVLAVPDYRPPSGHPTAGG